MTLDKTKEIVRELLPHSSRFRIKKFILSLFEHQSDQPQGAKLAPPPNSLNFVGDGDFQAVGEEFLHHFKTLAQLSPDSRVLDVGCGIGRIALPLTEFLSSRGSYAGFDIVREGIEWCNSHITPTFPNFRFSHLNIFNSNYNPSGNLAPETLSFPYPDNDFDFAFLTSVFTHLLPPAIDRYTAEIARVLKPGGKMFVTMFLINSRTQQELTSPTASINFPHQHQGYATRSKAYPEDAVAVNEDLFRSIAQKSRLAIQEPIYFGKWAGGLGLSYQDIIILEKES